MKFELFGVRLYPKLIERYQTYLMAKPGNEGISDAETLSHLVLFCMKNSTFRQALFFMNRSSASLNEEAAKRMFLFLAPHLYDVQRCRIRNPVSNRLLKILTKAPDSTFSHLSQMEEFPAWIKHLALSRNGSEFARILPESVIANVSAKLFEDKEWGNGFRAFKLLRSQRYPLQAPHLIEIIKYFTTKEIEWGMAFEAYADLKLLNSDLDVRLIKNLLRICYVQGSCDNACQIISQNPSCLISSPDLLVLATNMFLAHDEIEQFGNLNLNSLEFSSLPSKTWISVIVSLMKKGSWQLALDFARLWIKTDTAAATSNFGVLINNAVRLGGEKHAIALILFNMPISIMEKDVMKLIDWNGQNQEDSEIDTAALVAFLPFDVAEHYVFSKPL